MLQALGSFAQKYYSLPLGFEAAQVKTAIKRLLLALDIQSVNLPEPQGLCESFTLYHEPNFTLCFFVMKEGAKMPLHDHPHMTVFSRLLKGEFLVSSYEILPDQIGTSNLDSANSSNYVTCDEIMQSDSAVRYRARRNRFLWSLHSDNALFILEPHSGPNLHSFTCLSETGIFLDIIGPPYNDVDRRCTYYRDLDNETDKWESTQRESESITFISPIPEFEFLCESKAYQA